MKVKAVLIGALVITFAWCISALAWTKHPAEEYTANEVNSNRGLNAEYNYGDLTFHAPYPDPQTLIDMERYMVAGAHGDTAGSGMIPWVEFIYKAVMSLHGATGEIPAELSIETLRNFPLAGDAPFDPDAEYWNMFRSPITGEFPRLDAESFSPGQVYMRELTEDEVAHFASVLPAYQQQWFDGVVLDPETEDVIDYVTLGSSIYYMRVYGVTDVIYSNIVYILGPQTGR